MSKAHNLKSEGRRVTCSHCTTRFYHMQKKDFVLCPVCGKKTSTKRDFFNIKPARNLGKQLDDISDNLSE